MRERLRRSDYPGLLLRSRASEWYEKHNYIDEAIKHALAANDLQRAALLMESVILLTRGQISTLLGWKQALTGEIITGRAKLCMDFAWALALARDVDEAEHLLEPIVEIAAISPDLLSQVLILQAHIAVHVMTYSAQSRFPSRHLN